MPSLLVARLRLLALGVAVLFRVVAYVAVAVLAIQSLQHGVFSTYNPAALAAWLVLCSVPAILFALVIGPLTASRWNRAVTIAGTAIIVVVLAWTSANDDVPWMSVAGILSLEAAFFTSAVLASTASLSVRAAVSPVTLRWSVLLAAVIGVWLVAMRLGWELFANPRGALVAAVVSLAAIVFVGGSLPEPIKLGTTGFIRPFWSGMREIIRNRFARSAILGLSVWWFVVLAVLGVLIRTKVADSQPDDLSILIPLSPQHILTVQFLTAIVGGVLVSGLNKHPFRHSVFIVYGAIVTAASMIWLRMDDDSRGAMIVLGLALGMSLSPLVQLLWNNTQPKYHGIAASCLTAAFGFGAVALAVVVFHFGDNALAVRSQLLNVMIGVTGVAAILAFVVLVRPALEATAETLFLPFYRIRATGPGVSQLPLHGPCLVIGNHAAWFDPLFVAKVLPSPITPMMTSKFYDLPVLSWIMRHIIGTIRVPDVPYRHEAPELKEAVAALDQGAYVILFPEGYLRRKEEIPIRRFGRGVWKILSERPNTPVFACWIDGNWGSFFSYRGGPPMKGKRFDFLRRIRIGVLGPITLDAATLANHMSTRTFLMQQVAAAHAPLGLPPIDVHTVEDEHE